MDRRKQHGLNLGLAVGLACALTGRGFAQEPAPTVTPSPTPTVQPAPPKVTPTPTKPEPPLDRATAERRLERKARQKEIGRYLDGAGGDGPMNKLLERLPPDADRDAFRNNLGRWRDLSPMERNALRGQEDDRGERIKAEVEKAINDSGLHLNPDQREVYALRYVQERRRLERALRDQMGAERARRLPGMLEGLRKEFSAPPAATTPSATPAPKPTAAPSP